MSSVTCIDCQHYIPCWLKWGEEYKTKTASDCNNFIAKADLRSHDDALIERLKGEIAKTDAPRFNAVDAAYVQSRIDLAYASIKKGEKNA